MELVRSDDRKVLLNVALPLLSWGDVSGVDAQKVDAEALDRYFQRCRNRVPAFTQRHFRYPGAFRTNARALGWDLLRAPLNLFWAPSYVAALLIAMLLRRSRLHRISDVVARVPAGLATQVQIYVHERIESELLGLRRRQLQPEFTALTGKTLRSYASTRTATADISNSLASTVYGAVALKQFTPGGIAIGLALASWLARREAERDFILGETLGRWYVNWLPPDASISHQVIGVAVVLFGFSVLASLSGLLLDPLQARLGLHQYRLRRMLDHLEAEMSTRGGATYSPKDPYIARIFEVIDAARGPLA